MAKGLHVNGKRSIGHKILNIPLQILGELRCDLCTTTILDENLPMQKQKRNRQHMTRP
jgi:hypothetical protein